MSSKTVISKQEVVSDKDFKQQLAGYSLTTAEILYRMPDHPSLLQSYIWQEYDVAPQFPKLNGFLRFWTSKLDGVPLLVRVAHAKLLRPLELKLRNAEFSVN